MKRRSKLLIGLICCLMLVGCGSAKQSYGDSYNGAGFMVDTAASNSNKASGIGGIFDSISSGGAHQGSEVAPSYQESSDSSEGSDEIAPSDGTQDQGGPIIEKDMLVYHGDVDITTKDYEKSIEGLKELFSTYDCFIESSHEYTNYRYYDETDLMVYEATVRVNSKDYEAFMGGISDLGVVASKSSNVKNMNMEYSDTVTALRIQQARLDRYLERLETEYDNEIALQLERQISDIQIELQQLEARKKLIETDVAYSYVDIQIKEVKAYSSQVTHSDPLHKRVWAEVVNTYYEFTEFMVDALFFCIHVFPYVVIIVPIVLLVRKKMKGKIHLPKLHRRRRKSSHDTDNLESPSDNIDP